MPASLMIDLLQHKCPDLRPSMDNRKGASMHWPLAASPSLVKIAKPGEHPPVVGMFHRGRGLQKRPGFSRGRGPGRSLGGQAGVVELHLRRIDSFLGAFA